MCPRGFYTFARIGRRLQQLSTRAMPGFEKQQTAWYHNSPNFRWKMNRAHTRRSQMLPCRIDGSANPYARGNNDCTVVCLSKTVVDDVRDDSVHQNLFKCVKRLSVLQPIVPPCDAIASPTLLFQNTANRDPVMERFSFLACLNLTKFVGKFQFGFS